MDALSQTLGDLYEHAPCGLLMAQPGGEILAANETLLSWLDYGREEVVGRLRFQDLVSLPGKVYFETHIAPLLHMQGFVSEIALELTPRAGPTVPVLMNANASGGPGGEARRIRIALFRAEQRRRYERELLLARRMSEEALKAKSDLLATIAHDIRNPLGAVKLAAELIQRSGVPPPAQHSLATLHRALDRVLALLENMLELSRFEAGKAALQPHPFALRDLVNGIVETIAPAADRKRLPLHLEIDPDVPDRLVGDAVKIGQVLANLMGNAVKFTEQGAVTLAVRAVRAPDEEAILRFTVIDSGIGIPPDRIAGIFEEYAQAGPEIRKQYGGTGLGLAISQRILRLHGSELEVESTPGVGTTFSFELRLPVGRPGTPPATP